MILQENIHQVIQAVTQLDPETLEVTNNLWVRITFSSSQRGHKELPGKGSMVVDSAVMRPPTFVGEWHWGGNLQFPWIWVNDVQKDDVNLHEFSDFWKASCFFSSNNSTTI